MTRPFRTRHGVFRRSTAGVDYVIRKGYRYCVRSAELFRPQGERVTDLLSKINTVFQLLKMHPLGLSGTGYI